MRKERFKCELTEMNGDTQIVVRRFSDPMNDIQFQVVVLGTTSDSMSKCFVLAQNAGYTFSHQYRRACVLQLIAVLRIRAWEKGIESREQGLAMRDCIFPPNDWANRASYWAAGWRDADMHWFGEKSPETTEVVSSSIMGLLS